VGLRIAIFGEAQEARDVLVQILDDGHSVVGVYAPPAGKRPDPLAEEAEARGLPLFRHRRFRRKGAAIPEIVKEYEALGAELNVLPYTTVFLPLEILNHARLGSLCRHPSLLPRFRGGASIGWQIIEGEPEVGVTIFQPDEGVDAGPIVVQKGGVRIDPTDNAARLYYEKLYPLGVEATLDAVRQIAEGTAKPLAQDESEATFQPLIDDAVARIDWSLPADRLDRLMRGCDPAPGAHARLRGEVVRFHDAHRIEGVGSEPPGTVVSVDAAGLVIAAEGGRIAVRRVRLGAGAKVAAAESGIQAGDRLEAAPPADA
jgi:methionyl-tRNA formyltransferase